MGVERVDYYSDEEYQQALQDEEVLARDFARQQYEDQAQEEANEEHRREEQRKLEQVEMEKHFEKHPHG